MAKTKKTNTTAPSTKIARDSLGRPKAEPKAEPAPAPAPVAAEADKAEKPANVSRKATKAERAAALAIAKAAGLPVGQTVKLPGGSTIERRAPEPKPAANGKLAIETLPVEAPKPKAAPKAKAPKAPKAPKPEAAPKAPKETDSRLPAPGTVIKKLDRTGAVRCACTVVEGGRIVYNGQTYNSLSGAASAAAADLGIESKALNGFLFWGLIKPARTASAAPKGLRIMLGAALGERLTQMADQAGVTANALAEVMVQMAIDFPRASRAAVDTAKGLKAAAASK